MKKIKYIQFGSSDEFETWQDDNPTLEVKMIVPVPIYQSTMGVDLPHDLKNENTYATYGAFVTYVEYKFGEEDE